MFTRSSQFDDVADSSFDKCVTVHEIKLTVLNIHHIIHSEVLLVVATGQHTQ